MPSTDIQKNAARLPHSPAQHPSAPAARNRDAAPDYVPVAPNTDRVPTWKKPAAHHAAPLCSFGPGGLYVVDWRVQRQDVAENRRVFPPRTLVSALGRFVTWVANDLKGWLLASHPGRAYRIDRSPAAYEPCAACGHQTLWPHWFTAGEQRPQAVPQTAAPTLECPQSAPQLAPANDMLYPAADVCETTADIPEPAAPAADLSGDNDDDAPWPYLFRFSEDLEHVPDFGNTPAGALLARLTPAGLSTPADQPTSLTPNTEYSHDPDTQTTQNPHRDPRLPSPSRLLPDHAGTGRRPQSVKGDHLRTRRSARKEGTHPPCPEQGSLFGDLSGGQAA